MFSAQPDDEPVPRGLEEIVIKGPQPRDRGFGAHGAEVDGGESAHPDLVRLAVQFLVVPLDVPRRLDDRGRAFARTRTPARRRFVRDWKDDNARRLPAAQFRREIEKVAAVGPGVPREGTRQIGLVQCRQSGQ